VIRVRRKIIVERDPGAVFRLIDDPSRYSEFFRGITRWDLRSEKERGVGARYRVLMKVGSIQAGGTIRVTEWAENETIAWDAEQGIDQEGRWRLHPLSPGQTELMLEVGFDLSGGPVGKLVERLAGRIVARNMWATLLAVRRMLEAEVGRPRPDDGTEEGRPRPDDGTEEDRASNTSA
jgi:ribosome-associated toxin RatA of RatAB toxin-antitoxin module